MKTNFEVNPMPFEERLEKMSSTKQREFDCSVALDAIHRYLYEIHRNAESIEYSLNLLKDNCSEDSYEFFLKKFAITQVRRDAISIISKTWSNEK